MENTDQEITTTAACELRELLPLQGPDLLDDRGAWVPLLARVPRRGPFGASPRCSAPSPERFARPRWSSSATSGWPPRSWRSPPPRTRTGGRPRDVRRTRRKKGCLAGLPRKWPRRRMAPSQGVAQGKDCLPSCKTSLPPGTMSVTPLPNALGTTCTRCRGIVEIPAMAREELSKQLMPIGPLRPLGVRLPRSVRASISRCLRSASSKRSVASSSEEPKTAPAVPDGRPILRGSAPASSRPPPRGW